MIVAASLRTATTRRRPTAQVRSTGSPFRSRGSSAAGSSEPGPGGVDERASPGIANRRPARPGAAAPGPPRAELGGRRRGAAGDPGGPGRLAVPPRPLRPPGAPGRPDGRRRSGWATASSSGPLVVRFADLDIALRIEQRWPGLNDRLASTVQFLRLDPDDDRYGSPALREATVQQAIEETRSIDFREAIEYRPIIRAAASRPPLAWACAAADRLRRPGVVATRPPAALPPLGRDRWPQQTHLALSDRGTTLKIARGDSFTLAVKVQPGDRIPGVGPGHLPFADGAVLALVRLSRSMPNELARSTPRSTAFLMAGQCWRIVARFACEVAPARVVGDATRLHDEVLVEIVAPGQLSVHAVHEVEDLFSRVYSIPARSDHRQRRIGLAQLCSTFVRSHEDVQHAIVDPDQFSV